MGFATEEGKILAAGGILQFLDIGIIAAKKSVNSVPQPTQAQKKERTKK